MRKSALRTKFWILLVVLAAETARGAEDVSTLPEVVVTGREEKKSYNSQSVSLPKLTKPLADTPQTITVVPTQVMEDQGATSLQGALRNVPGVTLAAGEGGNQGDSLSIRGFTARSDIYVDGMRDFGSYYRDPFDLQEVEVLEGPASTLFGRGSTGGIVNQESKKAQLEPVTEGSLVLGSDLTRRATADVNRSLGEHSALRVNLMSHTSEVAGRKVVENRRSGLATSLAFGINTDTRFNVDYFHQTENNIPDYGIPFWFNTAAPVARDNYYGFRDANYLRTDVDIVTLKLEHDLNEQWVMRKQVRYANYDRNAQITEARLASTVQPGTPLALALVDRSQIVAKSNETSVESDLSFTGKFATGPLKHTLVAGFQNSHEKSSPNRFSYTGVPRAYLLTPNHEQSFAGTETTTSRTKAKLHTLALYALDTVDLSKQWQVSGGVRWDRAKAQVDQTVAPATAFGQTDRMTSWRGGVLFKPVPAGSIYFNYGTSFNPSAETLALSASTVNLDPEENQLFEVGTKWNLADDLLGLSFAVFRNTKNNARVPDPNNSLFNVLSGKQRVDGAELGLTGHPLDKWSVFAGYAFMESRVLATSRAGETGNRLANTPKHTVTLWTSYELSRLWEIGTGIRSLSSRATTTTPDTTTKLIKSVQGYTTWEAMAKYHLNRQIDLQMNIYNITDEYYIDVTHPNHLVPGAGRSVLLSSFFHF